VREDAAGHPFRFPLMVWQGSGSYQEMAEVIQAQLRAVGVAVDVRVLEFNTFIAKIDGTPPPAGERGTPAQGARLPGDTRRRDFAAAIGNWTDNLRKDDSQLFHSRNAGGPRFWSGFSSPGIDALLDSLAVTMDRPAAARLWRDYQRAIVDESPLIVLFYGRGINGVRRSLHGLVNDWRGPLASVQRWWQEPTAEH
jgi:peptide/nickel transport system substrate-binding protein